MQKQNMNQNVHCHLHFIYVYILYVFFFVCVVEGFTRWRIYLILPTTRISFGKLEFGTTGKMFPGKQTKAKKGSIEE
jgi:hypothetical protein